MTNSGEMEWTRQLQVQIQWLECTDSMISPKPGVITRTESKFTGKQSTLTFPFCQLFHPENLCLLQGPLCGWHQIAP